MQVSEEQIWESFRGGDEGAFKALYEAYFDVLYDFGRKFTPDVDDISTAIQDLFVKLWNNRTRLSSTTSVRNYLFTAYRRRLVRLIQKRNGAVIPAFSLEPDVAGYRWVEEETVFSREDRAELRNMLARMIDSLSPHEREIVYLKFYENFTYEEIAVIMDIGVKSTYKLLYKALDKLRRFGPTRPDMYLLLLCLCPVRYK